MANNKQIAADVLEAVGGKGNVSYVSHCMTRLRFNLKDRSRVDAATVKKLPGVLGAQESGGQFQVIIGTNVSSVYDELCALGGFAKQAAIQENLDGPKEKLTPKVAAERTLNFLTGSMTPMIPLLLIAGLCKLLGVLFGPSVLGLLGAEDHFVLLMNMVYSAVFYFLPIYLGHNAAKVIGLTPMVGALLGAVLIDPNFVALKSIEGATFSVYGIPAPVGSYGQSVVPILLTIPVAYFVEKLFKKVVPDVFSTFRPFFTVLVMLPLSFCLFAPLGSWVGDGIAWLFNWLGTEGGIFKVIGQTLIAALWTPLVVSGMHVGLITIANASFFATGSDAFILAAKGVGWGGLLGVQLATFLKLRRRQEKASAASYLAAKALGGVAEPFLYGMIFRYTRLLPCLIAANAVSGFLAAVLGLTVYVVGLPGNLLDILGFVGGDMMNIVFAVIALGGGFITGFVTTWLFGFTEDELENGPVAERA